MDIYKELEKFGYFGIVIGLIITIVGTIVRTKWFGDTWTKATDKILDKLIKKNNDHDIKKSDIINHDLFTYIDFWINSKVPTIQFSTDYRTAVFRKYLKIFLEVYKEEIYEFINSESYKEMDSLKLKKSLFDILNIIVNKYESRSTEVGIPNIVISKMKSKNNDTMYLTIDLISSVCESHFYENPNNYLKIYSILNIILSILESTILNSQTICNSINGELKNKKFIDNETGKTYIEP